MAHWRLDFLTPAMQPPPPITRALLIACTVLLFLAQIPMLQVFPWLALWPLQSGLFWPWQVLTYAFVHVDAANWFINMLALYLFGSQLEELWGSRRYIQFMLAGVVTAALAFVGLSALFGTGAPLAGASGAIFATLIAFAVLFPHRPILLFFIAQVTMRNAVLIFIGIEIFMMLVAPGRAWVSNVAHLGGMLGGYLMILWWRRRPPSFKRSPVRRVK